MHHHMQITAVVILLLAHSYIVLGGEDAMWQVLDGKVALRRQRDEGHACWSINYYVTRPLSDDY